MFAFLHLAAPAMGGAPAAFVHHNHFADIIPQPAPIWQIRFYCAGARPGFFSQATDPALENTATPAPKQLPRQDTAQAPATMHPAPPAARAWGSNRGQRGQILKTPNFSPTLASICKAKRLCSRRRLRPAPPCLRPTRRPRQSRFRRTAAASPKAPAFTRKTPPCPAPWEHCRAQRHAQPGHIGHKAGQRQRQHCPPEWPQCGGGGGRGQQPGHGPRSKYRASSRFTSKSTSTSGNTRYKKPYR